MRHALSHPCGSPLPPLFLLMFTGLYMFALPYVARWRSGSGAGAPQ